ncbi:MAG: hypothetical protein QM308_07405 [Bacillota bacterium]|nr:hypothetical protein [Bacillota bacterium]
MKRTLAALLAALMLLTFLPLTSLSARACTGFDIGCSLSTSYAYVGEEIQWWVENVQGTVPDTGDFKYRFNVYRNGVLYSEEEYHDFSNWKVYCFTSPGSYFVRVSVKGKHYTAQKDSSVINVKAPPHRITKVEPLGATSLKITWNRVPGARSYWLFRSTDLDSWTLVRHTTGTSCSNTYLKAGTRYFYKVFYDRDGVSNWLASSIASGVPMAKTRITSLTSPSARRIRMTWARAAGASGYQVAMATSPNGIYRTVRIVTGGTTAIFSGVKSGSALFFKVRPYRRIYTTTYWGQYSAYRSVRVK